MKNLRNEKGITLVALVVTIIVLLILAGVSLSLVAGGNGIIDKASSSVTATSEGAAKEQTELKFAELAADFYETKYVNGNNSYSTVLEYIAAKGNGATGDGKYTVAVTAINSNSGTVTVTGYDINSISGTVNAKGSITWNN